LPQCVADIFFLAGDGIRVCKSRKHGFAGQVVRQNPSLLPGMWRDLLEALGEIRKLSEAIQRDVVLSRDPFYESNQKG